MKTREILGKVWKIGANEKSRGKVGKNGKKWEKTGKRGKIGKKGKKGENGKKRGKWGKKGEKILPIFSLVHLVKESATPRNFVHLNHSI